MEYNMNDETMIADRIMQATAVSVYKMRLACYLKSIQSNFAVVIVLDVELGAMCMMIH